jgi:hypothetical protein
MCAEPMMLLRVFPRTWTLPEVRAFECQSCGNACSVACESPPMLQRPIEPAPSRV